MRHKGATQQMPNNEPVAGNIQITSFPCPYQWISVPSPLEKRAGSGIGWWATDWSFS